ncbi:MAG TPA: hypothetical protein VGR54_08860 [Nitrosopumilaceae archaeon]|nr:hypothetical protein [Nitrosopumilaceae archaeon]
MFHIREKRNTPTHPPIIQIIANPKIKYNSLLRCARSKFKNRRAPSTIRPSHNAAWPPYFQLTFIRNDQNCTK